ncbi:MAG: amino acid ABC transporter permease [Hyphomicrobiales bacterium]
MSGYHFNFHVVWAHWDKLAWGLLKSVELTIYSIAIGVLVGLILATAFTGGKRWIRGSIAAYVEFIRNVPLLLLVYLVFYGIPSVGGFAYGQQTSFIMTLSAYAGAQFVEVFRAGLDAVPKGLLDAGKSIGLTPWQRLLHVRFPVMLRIVLPSVSNIFVSIFKDTSLASVIAVPELAFAAGWIKGKTFAILEVYAVITPIYLISGYLILLSLRRFERLWQIRG